MAQAALVADWETAGRELIEQLDREGYSVSAAFWMYPAEREDWTLVLAMPLRDREGPLKAYEAIIDQLSRAGLNDRLPSWRITVVGPHDSIVRALRKNARTGPRDISSIRLSHINANPVFVEDALVYRAA